MTELVNGMTQEQFIAAIDGNLIAGNCLTSKTVRTHSNSDFLTAVNNNINGLTPSVPSITTLGVETKASLIKSSLSKFITDVSALSDFHLPEEFINSASNNPMGPSYVPAGYYFNGKTYFTYLGLNDNPCVKTYTHATGVWSNAYQVGVTVFKWNGHQMPAILVDHDGYIHVFYNGNTGYDLKYSRSQNPEDITSWDEMPIIGTNLIYPQVSELSTGVIYLFYKADSYAHIKYRTSSNGGDSWSAETLLMDFLAYTIIRKSEIDDTIHASWVYAAGTNYYEQTIIYYAYRDPVDSKWKNRNGDELTVPFDVNTDCKVYTPIGTKSVSFLPYPTFKNNEPYILIPEQDSAVPLSFTLKFAKWVTDQWVITTITTTTMFTQLCEGYIDVISTSVFDAYIHSKDRLVKWRSSDGGATWSLIAPIVANGENAIPIQIYNYQSDAKFIIATFEYHTHLYYLPLYLYGTNGFVTGTLNDTLIPLPVNIIPAASSEFITDGTAFWTAINTKTWNEVTHDMTIGQSGTGRLWVYANILTIGRTYNLKFDIKGDINAKIVVNNASGLIWTDVTNLTVTDSYQTFEFTTTQTENGYLELDVAPKGGSITNKSFTIDNIKLYDIT